MKSKDNNKVFILILNDKRYGSNGWDEWNAHKDHSTY